MEKINIDIITEGCRRNNNEHIVIIDDIKEAFDTSAPKQMLVEGYMFGIILQGSAKIIVDNEEYILNRGDLFGCNPRNILERSMVSMDIKVLGFFATPDYVATLLQQIKIDWSFLMMAKTHEVIHANDSEIERLVAYIELIRKKLESEDSTNKEYSIELLIQSMGLEIFDIRNRHSSQLRPTDFSSAENIVQRFVLMLTESSQHGKPYKNVNGYAELLNVTPKYFSHVCKNIVGKTASEIINEDIIRTAMMLLHDNNYSIKQISDRLGFANQSHFGTFFRRHTGESPLAYKKQ